MSNWLQTQFEGQRSDGSWPQHKTFCCISCDPLSFEALCRGLSLKPWPSEAAQRAGTWTHFPVTHSNCHTSRVQYLVFAQKMPNNIQPSEHSQMHTFGKTHTHTHKIGFAGSSIRAAAHYTSAVSECYCDTTYISCGLRLFQQLI